MMMATRPDPHLATTAFNRFGLGAKPGDLALAASDPRGFLLEEMRAPGAALIDPDKLPSSSDALQIFYIDQRQKRIEREAAAKHQAMQMGDGAKPLDAKPMNASPMNASPIDAKPMEPKPAAPMEAKPKPPEPPMEQKLFRAEATARFEKQARAPIGFVERLVAFWSNHFAVSVAKAQFVRVTAGPFEREAIRPHVLGKFADLLHAAETHPAMIFYLDNQQSIGPQSRAGVNRGKGLNENFAREILELHTLGAGGGYTQADVTSLARIITGWSFADAESEIGEPGAFLFKENWHEPGVHDLLGKAYAQAGRAQGEAALLDIARHLSTARHIATKLARHFVADDPPQDLVDALAKTFRDTDGDLPAVATRLLQHDRAWSAPSTKIRTPSEFVLAAARATSVLPNDPGPLLNLHNALGMPLWQPAGPNGFADTNAAWAAPEAMKLRLDVSWQMAQRAREFGHPLSLLDTVAGLAASRETREAVSRAESRPQAMAILFMSPEFQRR
jgi:uncharacterized protein (DUF1800 family)